MNAHHHEGVDPSLLAAPPAQPWACWQDSLAGRPQPFKALAPQQGFWRYRPRMAERGSPSVIWHQDGAWFAQVDGQPVADVAHVWQFSAKFPVSEKTYLTVLAGGRWPDEQPATEGTPTPGHNTATPEELALDAVRQADEAVKALIKTWGGAVTNEEQDAAIDGYDKRIAKLRLEADKTRKAEKDEFLKGGQAIDKKWNAVRDAALAAEKSISDAATAYRVERKRIADEAAEKERKEREAERLAHAAATQQAAAQNVPPPPAPIFTAARTPKRATGLRRHDEVVFDDLPGTVAWILAMQPVPSDFLEAVKTVANRRFVHGPVPGARIETSYRA